MNRPPAAKTYRRNWLLYNEGQAKQIRRFREILFVLCEGLYTEAPGLKGGAPRVPLSDLVYSAVVKIGLQEAARHMMSPLERELRDGFIKRIPKKSTIHNFFMSKEAVDILMGFIGET